MPKPPASCDDGRSSANPLGTSGEVCALIACLANWRLARSPLTGRSGAFAYLGSVNLPRQPHPAHGA